MDDDDIVRIDEENEDDQNQDDQDDQNEYLAININETLDNKNSSKNAKKRKLICIGLRSTEISSYIKRTPAQFGGSRRIEIVARELFPNLFPYKFNRKKLNSKQKRLLNRALFAESIWKIDRSCK
ncbi:unnamed protein product [Rhizophagus irregularis]|nr:unnamed protein product [Rhizophagus irregularis]